MCTVFFTPYIINCVRRSIGLALFLAFKIKEISVTTYICYKCTNIGFKCVTNKVSPYIIPTVDPTGFYF